MIDLFSNDESVGSNLLPYDGEVLYYPNVFTAEKSAALMLAVLSQQNMKQDEVIVFGKKHVMTRLNALVGDNKLEYGYSNVKRIAEPWGLALTEIKKAIENLVNANFNSCLINHYPSGEDGMGWHADNEKELGVNPVIASVSFGAERKFSFKHNEQNSKVDVFLQSGSLLLMKGTTQHNWKHTLPKSKKVKSPRMNLTFRNIYV